MTGGTRLPGRVGSAAKKDGGGEKTATGTLYTPPSSLVGHVTRLANFSDSRRVLIVMFLPRYPMRRPPKPPADTPSSSLVSPARRLPPAPPPIVDRSSMTPLPPDPLSSARRQISDGTPTPGGVSLSNSLKSPTPAPSPHGRPRPARERRTLPPPLSSASTIPRDSLTSGTAPSYRRVSACSSW